MAPAVQVIVMSQIDWCTQFFVCHLSCFASSQKTVLCVSMIRDISINACKLKVVCTIRPAEQTAHQASACKLEHDFMPIRHPKP